MMQTTDTHRPAWVAFLDAFVSMATKQLVIMLRYPVDFVVSFAEVLITVLLLTFAMLTFSPSGTGGGSESGPFGSVMMFGLVLYMFLADMLWTMGYNIRWEQYQGTLESLYLTPASKFASLVSRVVVSLVWTGLNVLLALIFVQYVVGRLPFHNPGLAVYILVMSWLGTFGLGFAFAGYTLLVKESGPLTASFLQFALMTLCAMFFPFSALPPIVSSVSRLIPFSYCVDAFRSTLMGYPSGFPELLPIEFELTIVTLFGLLMPFLGYALYRAAERKGRADGSLAEF